MSESLQVVLEQGREFVDPGAHYVSVQVGGAKHKTQIVEGRNPRIDETFSFRYDGENRLEIEIHDRHWSRIATGYTDICNIRNCKLIATKVDCFGTNNEYWGGVECNVTYNGSGFGADDIINADRGRGGNDRGYPDDRGRGPYPGGDLINADRGRGGGYPDDRGRGPYPGGDLIDADRGRGGNDRGYPDDRGRGPYPGGDLINADRGRGGGYPDDRGRGPYPGGDLIDADRGRGGGYPDDRGRGPYPGGDLINADRGRGGGYPDDRGRGEFDGIPEDLGRRNFPEDLGRRDYPHGHHHHHHHEMR